MAIDTLAVRVRRAIRTVRGENEAWVGPDWLVEQPGLERHTEVYATAAKSWLAFGDEAANLALLLDRAP